MIKQWPKPTFGRKGFFHLIHQVDSPSLREIRVGSQSRNMEVGAEAETRKECYLLACSPWFAEAASLCRGGTIQSGLGLPLSIKNMPLIACGFFFPGKSSLCHVDRSGQWVSQIWMPKEKVPGMNWHLAEGRHWLLCGCPCKLLTIGYVEWEVSTSPKGVLCSPMKQMPMKSTFFFHFFQLFTEYVVLIIVLSWHLSFSHYSEKKLF